MTRTRPWATLLALLGLLALPLVAAAPAQAAAPITYRLMVSAHADRSHAIPLAGATLHGPIAIFVSPSTGISRASFDRTHRRTGLPYGYNRTERHAPFDEAGTAADGTANLAVASPTDELVNYFVGIKLKTGKGLSFTETAYEGAAFTSPVRSRVQPGGVTLGWNPVQGAASYAVTSSVQTVTARGTTAIVALPANDPTSSMTTDDVRLQARRADGSVIRTAYVQVLMPEALHPEILALVVTAADRTRSRPLDGTTLSGQVYVSAVPTPGIAGNLVFFYPDDDRVDVSHPPYDLGHTAPDGSPLPYDTRGLPDGDYQLAAIETGDDVVARVVASFHIDNGGERTPA